MNACPWLVIVVLIASTSSAVATPPLVSGDVPTAQKGVLELYLGYQYLRDDEATEHELPGLELIYGLSCRHEISLETPFFLLDRPSGSTFGLGDVELGTKYRLRGKPESDAGASLFAAVKLPTGSRRRGLGSGATDFELEARWGWVIGRESVYLNLGRSWLGEGGSLDPWFYSGVWEHPVRENLNLLAEIYRETRDERGSPNTLASTLGMKWQFREKQRLNVSIGRSLRTGARSGPELRVYTGVKLEF